MSTQTKRLDKVEGSLTPKQAALLWLQEARQFPDSTAYSRSLKDGPGAAFPLPTMERQVEASVRSAMKGQPRREVDAAVTRACRDVVFLFKLVTTANIQWYETERALFMGQLAVVSMLGRLLDHKADATAKGKQHNAYVEHARMVVRLLESFLGEVLSLRAAFTAVGERFFDGEPILFAKAAADIDELVGSLGETGTLYNDAVGELLARKHPELRVMTVAEMEATVVKVVPDLAEYVITRAKAEALGLFGENDQAAELMGRYV